MTRLFTYVVAAVIAVSGSAHAAAAANQKPEVRCSSHQPAKVELACGLRAFRSNRGAARWIKSHRTLAVVTTHQTPHSLKYYVWRERVDRHWIKEAKTRLQPRYVSYAPSAPAGYPPHHALWMCLHGVEGPWDDTDGGYDGGLQMSQGWLGMFSGSAGNYSQLQQEWFAEKAYAANHYSPSFIYGQWLKWEYGRGDHCIPLE